MIRISPRYIKWKCCQILFIFLFAKLLGLVLVYYTQFMSADKFEPFYLDHQLIANSYKETKLKTVENSKCVSVKILYNNSHALAHYNWTMGPEKMAKFDCHELLAGESVLRVKDIQIKDGSYMYSIKLDVKYIILMNRTICYAQRMYKAEGVSENEQGSDPVEFEANNFHFKAEDNYTVIVKEHGFYYIKCLSKQEAVFKEVISILPRDMSKLTNQRRDRPDGFILNKIDSSSNPMYSNGDLFSSCNTVGTEPAPMNVLVIQMEAMSINHFRRMFPLTYELLSSWKDNTILENLMINGENTIPNTYSFFGGIIEKDEHLMFYKMNYNHFPAIWKDFEKLGYISMYNEDFLVNNIFTIKSQYGFKHSPSDYYLFPYWNKVESDISVPNKFCQNHKPIHAVYMNLIQDFVERMNLPLNKDRHYISVNNLKTVTHDQYEIPPGYDRALKQTLLEFEQKGYLKSTFLMILGDHGGRPLYYHHDNFNRYGGLEYANRFLSLKIPEILKNTAFAANLRANKKKLVSSFDLHKTLKHFYMISKNGLNDKRDKCRQLFTQHFPSIRVLRGISLLENMPQNRSCEEALIPVGFCTCASKTQVDETDFFMETKLDFNLVGSFLVDHLNNKTKSLKALCQTYKLKRILDLMRIGTTHKYQVLLLAEPGKSLFQAVIEVNNSNQLMKLKDRIVRVNKYGSQSDCLANEQRTYKDQCFCR